MTELINFADLTDPKDPEGRTFREVNGAKTHRIPVGSLVEIETGARLFVVQHSRDCDGTPLYSLAATMDDVVQVHPGFGNSGWQLGYSFDGLKWIR